MGKGEVSETSPSYDSIRIYNEDNRLLLVAGMRNSTGGMENHTFLLDTSAITTLDRRLYDSLGLEPELVVGSDVAPGEISEDVEVVRLDLLKAGDMEVKDSYALVKDLSFYEDTSALNVEGILGTNFLKYFTVAVDYDNLSMHLAKGSNDAHDLPGLEFLSGLELESLSLIEDSITVFSPEINLEIDGRSYSSGIDTGFAGIIEVTPDVVNLYESEKQERIRSSTAGDKDNYILRLDDVSLGNLEFDDILGVSSDDPDMVNLGNQFFAEFVFAIDFPGKRLLLYPKQNQTFRDNVVTTGLNVGLNSDKKFVVTGFLEGSGAEESGISVGDEIISINGMRSEMFPVNQLLALMESDFFGDVLVTVKNQSGNETDYVIEKHPVFPDESYQDNSDDNEQNNSTEVMVLGTLHSYHAENMRYTYQDIFDIIANYNPDIIALEIRDSDINQSAELLIEYYPLEMIQLLYGFDNEFIGFDWLGDEVDDTLYEGWADDLAIIKINERLSNDTLFRENMDPIIDIVERQKALALNVDPQELNSGIYKNLSNEYFDTMQVVFNNTQYEEIYDFHIERRDTMLDNIFEIIEENQGERMAFVIGINNRDFVYDAIEEEFGDDVFLTDVN
ncbi:MAG: aspartyl protease family protein [Candidatus Woesearchaeota archaeon]